MGIPWPPKEGHVIIASCTLWFGRIPSNCSEEDIRSTIIDAGEPSRITIINSRGCAYVTMKDRKSAFRLIDRLQKNIQVARKNVKLNWATGQGLKAEKYAAYWDSIHGISQIPYDMLPEDLDVLVEGGYLDIETLPPNLAGLYDEHGLKIQPNDPSLASTSDIQLPKSIDGAGPGPGVGPGTPGTATTGTAIPTVVSGAPTMGASFPFSVNQSNQSMPPFFGGTSPTMVPLPGGTYPPSGLPPPSMGNANPVPPPSGGTPKPVNPPQMMAMGGMRMGGYDGSNIGSAAPIMPPNFANPPPTRFSGPPSGFPNPLAGFRAARPGFMGRGGFDGAFRGRPPFPMGPNMPMMTPPPPFMQPPGMMPLRSIRPAFNTNAGAMHPLASTSNMPSGGAEKRKQTVAVVDSGNINNNNNNNEEIGRYGKKLRGNAPSDSHDPSASASSSSNSNFHPSAITAIGYDIINESKTNTATAKNVMMMMDDAGEQHVTSTTHDDDNGEGEGEPAAVVEVNNADADADPGDNPVFENDDLKAVTRTEDEILENAIIYGNEEDD